MIATLSKQIGHADNQVDMMT